MNLEFHGIVYTFWFSYQIVHIEEDGKPSGLAPFEKPTREDFFTEVDFRAANRSWHQAHREAATCSISWHPVGEEPGDIRPQIEAQVIRHYRDVPNRRVAREAALTKALDHLTDRDYPGFLAAKGLRQAFWSRYFQNCRASANTQETRNKQKLIELKALLGAIYEYIEPYTGTEPLRMQIRSAIGV